MQAQIFDEGLSVEWMNHTNVGPDLRNCDRYVAMNLTCEPEINPRPEGTMIESPESQARISLWSPSYLKHWVLGPETQQTLTEHRLYAEKLSYGVIPTVGVYEQWTETWANGIEPPHIIQCSQVMHSGVLNVHFYHELGLDPVMGPLLRNSVIP